MSGYRVSFTFTFTRGLPVGHHTITHLVSSANVSGLFKIVVFEILQCLMSSIARTEMLISTKCVVFVTFEVLIAVLLC